MTTKQRKTIRETWAAIDHLVAPHMRLANAWRELNETCTEQEKRHRRGTRIGFAGSTKVNKSPVSVASDYFAAMAVLRPLPEGKPTYAAMIGLRADWRIGHGLSELLRGHNDRGELDTHDDESELLRENFLALCARVWREMEAIDYANDLA